MKEMISQEDIVVISSYPPKDSTHHKSIVGVASYSKNTLLGITKALVKHKKTTKLIVLAEKLPDSSDTYQEEGIFVERVWNRKSLSAFFTLASLLIAKYGKPKTILIEFELSMFGGMLSLFPFPLFLLLLKLS